MTKKTFIVGLLISFLCLQSASDVPQDGTVANSTTVLCQNDTIEMVEDKTLPMGKAIGYVIATIAFMFSVLCNGLITYIIKVNPHMHTTTNYLIVNMAVGDLFASVLTTFGAMYVIANGQVWTGDEDFGRIVFCKTGYCCYFVFMLCSIFSVVGITLDRFLAVTRPLKHKHHSSWTKYAIPVIWLVAIAIPANYAVNEVKFCSVGDKFYCIDKPSSFDGLLIFSLGFAFPHVVIVILYIAIAFKLCTRKIPGAHAQESAGQTAAQQVAKKVTYMIICIFVAFELSWAPIFLGYILLRLYFNKKDTTFAVLFLYKMLMILNGVSNFFIYITFNQNFRRAFKNIFRCKTAVLKRNCGSGTDQQEHFDSKQAAISTVSILLTDKNIQKDQKAIDATN